MRPLLIAFLALAGWLAGWPQAAVIFRYAVPPGEPPRVNCLACGHQVQPASSARFDPPGPWALLRFAGWPGRCPACQTRTWPPALATAILLGLLAARVHPGLVLAATCWLAVCAVPLAGIDIAVHRLPDELVLPAYAGTILFLLLAAAGGGHSPTLLRAVLGGAALAGFYLALSSSARRAWAWAT